ncbi:hypothetical protein LINPERHAP1_LOCUS8443, partial [Linum perenne]
LPVPLPLPSLFPTQLLFLLPIPLLPIPDPGVSLNATTLLYAAKIAATSMTEAIKAAEDEAERRVKEAVGAAEDLVGDEG